MYGGVRHPADTLGACSLLGREFLAALGCPTAAIAAALITTTLTESPSGVAVGADMGAKTSRVCLPARYGPRRSQPKARLGLGLRFSSGDGGEGWSWLVIETEALPLHLDNASFCLRLAGDAVDGRNVRDVDGDSARLGELALADVLVEESCFAAERFEHALVDAVGDEESMDLHGSGLAHPVVALDAGGPAARTELAQ